MGRGDMGGGSDQSKWALAMTVGTVIAANVVAGIVAGYWLDRWLGTRPWLLIAGVALGTVGAFLGLYRIVSRLG